MIAFDHDQSRVDFGKFFTRNLKSNKSNFVLNVKGKSKRKEKKFTSNQRRLKKEI